MKKALAIGLASALLLTLFTGCSGSGDSSSGSGSTNKVLKVAAIETAYGSDMWQQIKTAFEAENEGVEIQLTTDKNLEDVIGPKMKSGDYPDVIHLATGRPAALTETMIKDNALRDLSSVLSLTVPGESTTVKDKILPGFLDTSLTNPYSNSKTYLMPMFYGPCGLFYNADLFQKKGWSVPKTWDEMWQLGDKAKAEGISLFTYPTTGYFDAFFYAMMYSAGGDDFFKKATQYSEGVWDTAEAGKIFDTVAKLAGYTDKTTVANANNDNYLKNQQLVLNNEALFMPNGTWVVGEMTDAPKADGFQWGFAPVPSFQAGGDLYSYTFFEQIWSPKEAKNPELANQFIAFLYSDKAADIFRTVGKGGAYQPVKGITDKLEGENKMMYSIYNDGTIKPAMGAFATTDPVEGVSIADSLFGTVNSLVSGDKTVAQWKEAVIKASDALRAALK